jgi:hypothetical protein
MFIPFFDFGQKLLMDPNLDCSDPEYKRVLSLDYVGYRLENAGLVIFLLSILFFPPHIYSQKNPPSISS